MKVLSHRGLWASAPQKNTVDAFVRSFDSGWGTETDVRDLQGELVISHDMARGGELTLDAFLALHAGRPLPLAMNVKADGLAEGIAQAMRRHEVPDWFVFDMSVPDMRMQLKQGNPVFTRMSEVERQPAWLDAARGVWLDGFEGTWFGAGDLLDLLRRGKQVCVVSPELHGRDHSDVWNLLRPLAGSPALMLCTDMPEQASKFLGLAPLPEPTGVGVEPLAGFLKT